MTSTEHVVVLGASAGGVESLRAVAAGLPEKLDAAVFVVLHVPPYQESSLPQILNFSGPLRASHAEDGDRFKTGRIYVAPPDHHLLVESGRVAVKRGPKENRFRPSIDALFRSAAYNYGSKAIGVVLSGALDDGTSGLWTLKRLGGTAIVQHPDEARFESMPLSASEQVNVDYSLPAAEIGPVIGRLTQMRAASLEADPEVRQRVETELAIAREGGAFQKGIMDIGELTPFTCPECHGVLVRLKEDRMTRYRCHTGHGYSDSALLGAVTQSTGEHLWQVMRSFEEAVMLVEHMGRHIENGGDAARAGIFFTKARELEQRSKMLHEAVQNHESLSGDNLAGTPKGAKR
jgi:two-component system chemotaxis response regulator CheB